jgi:hypothetical protein
VTAEKPASAAAAAFLHSNVQETAKGQQQKMQLYLLLHLVAAPLLAELYLTLQQVQLLHLLLQLLLLDQQLADFELCCLHLCVPAAVSLQLLLQLPHHYLS